jgi:UDP-N-acetyl-D-glucosamine/UDP-N-acetyl-D-galactosamine dehydrogenase
MVFLNLWNGFETIMKSRYMDRIIKQKKFVNLRIGIIGLGYVGLPLAVEFGKKYNTTGYDINSSRIEALKSGHDTTFEVSSEDIKTSYELRLTNRKDDLKECNFYIVTVPTPIDSSNHPDLSLLINASEMIGSLLNVGDIIVYESTVYPGATEEECVPVLERISGLYFNKDFSVGYSPERINPGDKEHTLTQIKKVTSGSTLETAEFIDQLYASIIIAGTYKAESIRVAEAAKVIENTQRDINIALVNELAIIFNRLNIDTAAVLRAASTKWNFLNFRPGLVGGHCIGVDPYYLTYKAEMAGHHPEIILAGRRLNDNMGAYVAGQLIKKMLKQEINVSKAKVLILGLTFKENCPDLRNTRVVDIINELDDYGMKSDVWDPWVNSDDAEREFGIKLVDPKSNKYDAIIFAVAHEEFVKKSAQLIAQNSKSNCVVYDIKGVVNKDLINLSL